MYFGESQSYHPWISIWDLFPDRTKLEAKFIDGDDIYVVGSTIVTDEIVTVEMLLGPLTPKDLPILRCVGLNYAKHSR